MTAPRSRVLLVDDHAVVRLGMRAMIDREPDLQVVGEAGTGPEALVRYRELRPDLTVADLVLPGMDGVQLCEAIRAGSPHARIVIVSGSPASEHVHRALKAGAQGYLLKGATPVELLAALRDVAAGRRVVPAQIAHVNAEHASWSELSPREREVIQLVVDGLSDTLIADRLSLTEATVKTHLTRVFEKLGVENRAQAAIAALTLGIARTS